MGMHRKRRWLPSTLAMLMGIYGLTMACVCTTGHEAVAAMPSCHHCDEGPVQAAGTQVAAHHQCCGMERAPVAVERIFSPSIMDTDAGAVLLASTVFSAPHMGAVALSSRSHAPPHHIPIYFTTQRFVI